MKAGQLIAEIDSRDEQATANSARQSRSAKAQLNSADADYNAAVSRVRFCDRSTAFRLYTTRHAARVAIALLGVRSGLSLSSRADA